MNWASLPLFGMCRTAVDAQYDENVKINLIERIIKFMENDTIFYWEESETKLGMYI
mgnify:CR=1 FL=1